MPFSELARDRMLSFIVQGVRVGIGTLTSEVPELGRLSASFIDGANTEELIFDRMPFAADLEITHWHVLDADMRTVAYDKLERPILLRKGERATFPPGALRLELK